MKRQGRIRITIPGRAQDSYAELYLPIEEVLSGLHNYTESGTVPITIPGFYDNGDGVYFAMRRIPQGLSIPQGKHSPYLSGLLAESPEHRLVAALTAAVVEQARNISPKLCGAAAVLHEKLAALDKALGK